MNAITQIATVDGLFDFTIPVMGTSVSGSADVMGSNASPFLNLPPEANAGADISASCPGTVMLDGSASTDPQNNITEFVWRAGYRVISSRSPTAPLLLGAGVHDVSLTVFDRFGSLDTDTFRVNVSDPPPRFTFVPSDLTVSKCGVVDIGSAQASSPCEEVEVKSDAPSFFYAGVTIVTWTARTRSGKVLTETQRVVVMPNDDAACCPPGSYVLLGTSNNDVLNGTTGRDCILGRNGQDIINGGGGDDIISGGEGDDQISGGFGNDVVNAGNGQDKVFGNAGDDALFGSGGDDRVEAGAGNDLLGGGQGQDKLYGGDGNDEVLGNDGDDQLFGEAGDDLLDGGENNDQCTGGPGTDQFASCAVLDPPDTPPPGGRGEDFSVCECRPNKCADCSSGVQTCNNTVGCRSILDCVHDDMNCNLPHECAATCESAKSQAAINAARTLASCFGGC